jgi:hypothetical protein
MRSGFQRISWKLWSGLLATTFLWSAGPPALQTIERVDFLLAQISLELCQVGLAVWRICGI